MLQPRSYLYTAGAALLLLLAGLPLAVSAGQKDPAARPNVVFILTDDQRWDALGCMGHPFFKSPNIDRIAKEGALFKNAFVTTPLCSPARGSYLTGTYVHTHGVRGNDNNNARSHQLVTFPRLLHDAGYETAYVGKWHMGNDDTPRPGFDRWVSFKGQGVYLNPQLNIDGKVEQVPGYITDILSEQAVRFLRQPRTKPFCLYLAEKAVHGPFTPAERHKDLYSSDPIVRAPNAKDDLHDKPALTRLVDGTPAVKVGGGSGDALIRNQIRCLQAVDEGVGQVLKTLQESNQLDNTLVIFTSDNGYFWGEHSLGDKRWAFDEGIRVPLVMRYPKLIKAGTVLDQVVLNIDIAPTVLDLAGVSVPRTIQGRSLLPLFRQRNGAWRKAALFEYFLEPAYPRQPGWQAVRTDRWKYVHYTDLQGMDELYDLKADPYEMKNLINDPASAAALKDLKEELAHELAATAG